MDKLFLLVLMLFFASATCYAAQPSPDPVAYPHSLPCPTIPSATYDRTSWSVACFYQKNGKRYVKPEYRSALHMGKESAVMVEIADPLEYVVVNKKGEVVFGGIYPSTNDFEGTNNMHRYYSESGKCGYFHPKSLRIAIPAQWDQCFPFREPHQAEVCTSCEVFCTDSQCHSSEMVGGTGMLINRRGKVLASYPNQTTPTLPQP